MSILNDYKLTRREHIMLEKIVETKKKEIENLQLPEQIEVSKRSFYTALKNSSNPIALIAEVKKASPSKGIIKDSIDPVVVAKGYEKGGADTVSVLTDQTYFKGRNEYLIQVKKNIDLPVIRKDFMIDSIQIKESARIGADAILLIAEVLSPNQLHEFYQEAEELGMDCLVEVHSEASLEKVLDVFTPKILGVNNRNLKTFETSILQTQRLAKSIPAECLFVSESGIHTTDDLAQVRSYGAGVVLVGEALMRAESPEDGVRNLFKDLIQT